MKLGTFLNLPNQKAQRWAFFIYRQKDGFLIE